jgi:hypothetical protein
MSTISSSRRFRRGARRAGGACDALLAIIGPGWLDAQESGQRRLDDPHDFVRIEIEAALT